MTKRATNKEQVGRVGALVVLACCFLASAALRAGDVIAALPGGDDGFGNPVLAPHAMPKTAAEPEPEPEPGTLLAELRNRREIQSARERELDAREQELEAIEERLRTRVEELQKLREEMKKWQVGPDEAAEQDVRQLAEMYQQMKPKKAGEIFNEMAPSFAAGFLSAMRPEAAAQIMGNMEAEKAYAVSVLMASRNLKPRAGQAAPEPSQAGSE